MIGAGLTREQIRAEVRRIQESAGFATAPTLRNLLEFTVEKALNGEAAEIKESTLAVEVFGRKTSFDPQSDPIVRVQARKIRDRITAYYETDGAQDEVVIEYVRGSYVPRFVSRSETPLQLRSVAILPFSNLGHAEAFDYFCDGLRDEISYLLSRVHGLRIVARSSALSVRARNEDVQKIGQMLNADLLIQGTVREFQGRVRITMQLIETEDGFHVWSERWERPAADIVQLQNDIASAVARAMRHRVSPAPTDAASTHDLAAYHLFMKGRFYWNQRTEHGFRRAIEHFEAALTRDPSYARALAALAETYVLVAAHHLEPALDCLLKARDCARRAITLDPKLSSAHSAMATTLLFYERNVAEAEREWKIALDLDPTYAYGWHAYSVFASFVKPSSIEPVAAMQYAMRLDPLSAPIACDLAIAHYNREQYQAAIEQCHAALDLHPTFSRTYVFLSRAQAAAELYDAAIETCIRARPMFTGRAFLGQLLATLGYSYGRTAQKDRALAVLQELEESSGRHFVSAIDQALILTGIGDFERAMHMLEQAFELDEYWIISVPLEPLFHSLHAHPRFRALADRILRPR